jgi:hypothetical protein
MEHIQNNVMILHTERWKGSTDVVRLLFTGRAARMDRQEMLTDFRGKAPSNVAR